MPIGICESWLFHWKVLSWDANPSHHTDLSVCCTLKDNIFPSTHSEGCFHQFLSSLRKISWAPLWLDSLHAVKHNICGLGWNILLCPVPCCSRFSSVVSIMGISTRRTRNLMNYAHLAHNGAIRITWHWWHSVCFSTRGMRQIGGYAYAFIFTQLILNTSCAYAPLLGCQAQNVARWWFWSAANRSINGLF